MDHDQRFKTLIREFFAEFLELFFADWASRLDLTTLDWLDKEVFFNPPGGTRHELDLVARVPIAGHAATDEMTILLVHIEIESPDTTSQIEQRLPYYYQLLRNRYQLPVMPIVIYLRVGLDGIGTKEIVDQVWETRFATFRYFYVGLPGLDGVKYVESDNWLATALAALMRIPREKIVWLGAEALRKIASSPLNDQKKYLLGECVQAYLEMDDEQTEEFDNVLKSQTYKEAKIMKQTIYARAIEEGHRLGLLEVVEMQLSERFGRLSEATLSQVRSLSEEDLKRLALQIFKAESLQDLGLVD